MATLIFILLILSFFAATSIAFSDSMKDKHALAYVLGGLAMAAIYELYKIMEIVK